VGRVLLLPRFGRQAIHHSARGFICREKAFNAEFLQHNVQRRAQGGERRKQAKRRVLPPVVDGQKRWRSAIRIEYAPAARHARIAEQLFKETLQRLVRRVVCNFAVHPPNDVCGDRVPVFDKGPQPLRMKYQAGSVQWRRRIAAGEEGKKALCPAFILRMFQQRSKTSTGFGSSCATRTSTARRAASSSGASRQV